MEWSFFDFKNLLNSVSRNVNSSLRNIDLSDLKSLDYITVRYVDVEKLRRMEPSYSEPKFFPAPLSYERLKELFPETE
jgi:hypothetical protein